MSLLNKKKRKSRSLGGVSRIRKMLIGCGFCWEPLPEARMRHDVFTGGGCLGGRCECGAVFVVDETGREGGMARLDVMALVCDGDLDRAERIDAEREVEFKTRDLSGGFGRGGRRAPVQGLLPPKVWFARLRSADPTAVKPPPSKRKRLLRKR